VDPILSGHPQLSRQQSKSHFSFPTFTVKNTCIQRTPLLSRRGHLKLDFYGHFLIVRNLYQTDTAKRMHDFFVHVLVAQGHLSLSTNWAITEMHYFVICFYRTFVLVWFSKHSHDSINIDTVTVYLNHFTPYTCHCLWKYGISEFLTIHKNAIWPFQGLLLLMNINMTLLRWILREPVFNRHPVLSRH